MEANINNYFFKLSKSNCIIEIFNGCEDTRPCGFIRVEEDVSEKEFHIEITDWYMNNSRF